MNFTLSLWGLLFCLNSAASDKIYKWVDANGQNHYTTEKPNDKSSQEMKIRISKKKPVESTINNMASGTNSVEKRFDKFRKIKKGREQQKQKIIANKNKCQKAKSTLARFKQQIRFAHVKEDGTKEYLEDSKRKEILEASNKAIKKYCK